MVLLLLGLTWHLEERNDFTLNGRIKEGRKDPERKGQTIMAGLHILTIITLPKIFLFYFFKTKALHAEYAEYWQLVQCI